MTEPQKSIAKILTISVDDGAPEDLQTATLLKKYGLSATFYVPQKNPERPLLAAEQLREIASDKDFELGGHTVSHLSLHHMSDDEAKKEIETGKRWLEDTIGKRVSAFCYPQGKFNKTTPRLVREAGFLGGRTCMFNRSDIPKDPFLWGVSTHAYSHSTQIQVRHALIEGNFRGAVDFFRVHKGENDWASHFSRALDYVDANGGVAHLYFHSWEIDDKMEWDKLETVLKKASEFKNFSRKTNGELFSEWQMLRREARS